MFNTLLLQRGLQRSLSSAPNLKCCFLVAVPGCREEVRIDMSRAVGLPHRFTC